MRDAGSSNFIVRLRRRRRELPGAVPMAPVPTAPDPESLVRVTAPRSELAAVGRDRAPGPFADLVTEPSYGRAPSASCVLLIGDDRRFRALASTLLSQRGYTVLVGPRGADVAELAAADEVDVVVIDASASLTAAARDAARVGSIVPPVGIVAVSSEAQTGLAALPVLSKWSSFDALFDAIDRAHAGTARERVTSDAH